MAVTSLNKGEPCSKIFEVEAIRSCMLELRILDLVVLGQIFAGIFVKSEDLGMLLLLLTKDRAIAFNYADVNMLS